MANEQARESTGFVRGLGRWDATMVVAGSMIGSGIFIVSADIARLTGSAGGLLAVWVITGLLTIAAALAYGELAGMMPKAGGQYVYLREAYSPLWGFLYGWTLFLVIQTGTIAAVAVGFARFLGVLFPSISPTAWIVEPIHLSEGYALSLSVQQLVGIVMIVVLTYMNTRGLALAKTIQNVFTSAKTLALFGLIAVGLFLGANAGAIEANFTSWWTPQNAVAMTPGFAFLPTLTVENGWIGLGVALAVAQVGSLFSSDAWNNIGFAADEVKDARKNIAFAMATGTILVIALYLLANLAYLVTLPLAEIQSAPDDRVATAALRAIFGDVGATIMAIFIVISTFGCNNGLILAGSRVYYAMARDRLFFRSCGELNSKSVPAVGLWLQCLWACALVLPRTIQRDSANVVSYGNLYSSLLDYVVFAVLLFYVLTIAGVFVLRFKQPNAERPYKAWGYPLVPAAYVVLATGMMLVLIGYKTQMTWPGLVIVLTGIPVYAVWRRSAAA
ncbi:MAG: amino acid permease [Planctomycetes bacterium]|nr:amino acid permease [Planctomycetota bacterium]